MTNKEFERVVLDQLEFSKNLLIRKGEEYSLEEDRLIAFKKAARLQNETPKQSLCGMMTKHVISLYDMCESNEIFTEERWREKITDTINYLLLLRALVVEEKKERPTIGMEKNHG